MTSKRNEDFIDEIPSDQESIFDDDDFDTETEDDEIFIPNKKRGYV